MPWCPAGRLSKGHEAGTAPGSTFAASTLCDIERGAPIEADHIGGDVLRREGQPGNHPTLRTAYAHLKAYDARRKRENAAGQPGDTTAAPL